MDKEITVVRIHQMVPLYFCRIDKNKVDRCNLKEMLLMCQKSYRSIASVLTMQSIKQCGFSFFGATLYFVHCHPYHLPMLDQIIPQS